MIDTKSQEIKPADNQIYSDMLELAEELPDSSPRFILLSYPLTLVCRLVGETEDWNSRADCTRLALRSIVGPVCSHILSARELQPEQQNELCGRGRAHAQYGGGQQGD